MKSRELPAYFFLLTAFAAVPILLGQYYISLGTGILISILMLSSYRIVILTGEWSFAHVVFQGVGAYTAAISAKDFGASFPVCLAAGAIVTAACATLLSIPLLRMRGFYFIMGSFGAAEAIRLVWRKLKYFGGTRGISGVSAPQFDWANISIDFGSGFNYYYLCLAVVVICLVTMWYIERSRVGRIWRSIEQQDLLAQSVGIDTKKYRRIAFVVSAGFAGIAGVLLAFAFGSVTPNRFNLTFALYLMIWAIAGGTRTFLGVIVGGVVLMCFNESLRFADELRPGIYGLVLIVMMIFCPSGLEGLFGIGKRFSGLSGSTRTKPAAGSTGELDVNSPA